MSAIPDRRYNAACGRLASRLGVSLASARRKVDMRAAREGLSDPAARLELAERMLEEEITAGLDRPSMLSAQLNAVASDELFMTED